MAMSVYIDAQDSICVTHDKYMQGEPAELIYDEQDNSIYLLCHGSKGPSEVYIGTVSLARMAVRFKDLSLVKVRNLNVRTGPYDMFVPVSHRRGNAHMPAEEPLKAAG